MNQEIATTYKMYALMRLEERYGERSEAWRLKAKDIQYDVCLLDMIFDVMLQKTSKENNRFLHWKEPISCEIPPECINIAETACIFFHGPSNPNCYTSEDNRVFIRDSGYCC